MIIGKDKQDEVLYLNKTLNRIQNLLKEAGDSEESQSNDIKSDRRLLWDSIKELDEIEVQHFNQNLAMQEKLYLKNREKIKTLRNQLSVPYFARIDFKETGESPESIYIGVSSVMEDDFDFLVLDWRSPISNMFYDYEMGPSKYQTPNGEIQGEIILNRQYNIKNSEIKFIHENNSSIHDEALLSVLGSNTSDKMKNIVSSIQKKQNEIIRNDKTKVLLIQGVAGSGKTSIAMHRAAYLLYKYRKTLKANDILIFSPNNVFSEYISDVLPGLGESNISETTLEDFYTSFLPRIYNYEKKNDYLEYVYSNNNSKEREIRDFSMKYKNSLDFSNNLEAFLEKIDSLLTNFKDIVFDNRIIVRKSKLSEIFLSKFKNISFIDRIDSLKGNVFSIVETKYFTQLKNKNSSDFGYNPFDHGNNIQAYLKEEVSKQIDSMFKTLNPVEIYKMFWFSLKNNKNLLNITDLTLTSIDNETILFEDIIPILYLKMYMDGFKNYNKIQHVIIDECQDYSPLFYKMVNKIFKKASFTILGDINQKISSHTNIDKKEDIKDIFGAENTEIVSLTKSYRSTFEITEFAKNILEFGEPVEGVERHGDIPTVLENVPNIDDEILKIINEVHSKDLQSISIITKTSEDASNLFNSLKGKITNLNLIIDDEGHYNKGITIIPSYISKGLEFDAVIVPDMDMYTKDSERNLLYTVCTRALHSLYLLSKTKKSNLLHK
ncbi:AAA family ATPase [uncultured Clostridium sp.]|uniref:HelD family protein n=1 Tax=uncultured Clostridium sp. TaxID=59620 RepID=UPI0026385700|nr:AAA family ATPase [uncultured Clostridium sp.]